ncbi:fructosamine kinase family protein [Ornithinimicrobium avium]|uniref:Fructosamine kinase n=1 Tax=Ornithinimicrobium avium TaxID=2283195 RepID=A0A345NR35_9MICO|nr:fructosamine kinase family protein [Ornithinimicrobium avium]AXH97493.1 fructosamine kinase [Ornithinimicrobium avium]
MPGTGTTARTTDADGRDVFTKTLAGAPPLFFEREAVGLRALAAAGARVPEVLDVAADHLTLAWVETGHGRTAQTEERFGQELAELHRSTAQESRGAPYGSVDGEATGYLGACPVDLTPTATWQESWVERRVVPLARRAVDEGQLDRATAALAEQITPDRLGPAEPPTLVHGDLWGGNRMVDTRGRNWMVDPCAHLGHREVDLAMMQLFGGFSGRVFAAYAEVHPLADGWRERVAVYQTVPLLVHAILFGGGYGVQAGEALREATR